jgi:UDP-N-acetylmuramyl pentapeptide phosphotransferase/UDP-N-acetylglucosamine-1-phosphate transferase
MSSILLSFLTAFVIAYLGIPPVVRVASIRNIFDTPDERKIHKKAIPALGGVAMFAALFFSVFFWSDSLDSGNVRWMMLAAFIMFLQGLKDDILAVAPAKKVIAQLIVAVLLFVMGNVRVVNLHGFAGLWELNWPVSLAISLVTITGIINAFNLIDGIDGLAGSLGVVASATFGVLFWVAGNYHLSIISFSLTGALLGFLRYNFSPASIFMGDGGSLVVGLLLSILTIKLVNMGLPLGRGLSSPLLALAILIVPVTDTLRVFFLRIRKGKSPFSADRNHLHHLLLDMGLNHRQIVYLLVAANLFFIGLAYLIRHLPVTLGVLVLVLVAGGGCLLIERMRGKHMRNKTESELELASASRESSDLLP